MTGKGIGHLEQAVSELSRLSNWSPELAIAEGELGKALLSYSDTAYGAAAQHLLIARRIYSSLGISSAVRDLDDLILSAITVKRASKKERLPLEGNVSIVSRSRLDPRKFGMVTEDERIVGDLERWGPTEARILIEGETGVGKEVMARALHAMSRRREGPFVTVDCGALNETLADSELFGHARGAFTGAMRDRVGLIEEAGGGTLFLDEIGELSTALQVKLLRVLEEGVVRRVGENVAKPVDVRVICATARNLWAEVETGNFRRDLYYRLKTALIRIPSLKERPYDIEPLMQYYLDFYCKRYGKHLTL
ncbi:MAG TPA: sigma-54-dependent Fis family transcriptional regulator, partial [Firmicutes bacterium]|nr:sigma-54-dependent Fis family transcriptional regulator [Bacillota bacterium]